MGSDALASAELRNRLHGVVQQSDARFPPMPDVVARSLSANGRNSFRSGAQTRRWGYGVAIMQHGQGWIPRLERVEIAIDAVIHRSDDSKVAVRLVNMSFDGCEIDSFDRFEVGERVRIQIGGQGFIEAEMRSVSTGRCGARFLCECHV